MLTGEPPGSPEAGSVAGQAGNARPANRGACGAPRPPPPSSAGERPMRPSFLVLRKDLLVLRRSPALLGVLIAYPLVIALLIGLTAAYANAKPRVALVDLDGIPPTVT